MHTCRHTLTTLSVFNHFRISPHQSLSLHKSLINVRASISSFIGQMTAIDRLENFLINNEPIRTVSLAAFYGSFFLLQRQISVTIQPMNPLLKTKEALLKYQVLVQPYIGKRSIISKILKMPNCMIARCSLSLGNMRHWAGNKLW